MLVLMLVSLYTTRVLLKVLGIDDYGIFNVVGGVIVMITFINQGLAGAARRYIMAEITIGDLRSQRAMFTNVMLAHLIMCLCILLLGESIGLWFFSNYLNIPENRYTAALWVYHLSLITSIANIMISPYSAVIVSEEKMSIYAYFSIIDAILKLLIVWLLMIVGGDKLIWYSLFLVGVVFVDYMMYYYYCRSEFLICRIVKLDNIKQIKSLFVYMGWTVFGLGANVTSRQGVTMLVNIYFNVAVNAAIGISNTIIGAASQFVNNFQMAFAPQLTKQYLAGNYKELNSLVSRASRLSSYLVLIMLIPISIVLSDLLNIWLGVYPKYTEEFCLLTLVCIYFDAMSNPLTTVITADENIRLYQLLIACIYLMTFIISWCVLILGALPFFVVIVRILLSIIGMAVRLVLIKNKVYSFSAYRWVRSILGRGLIIALLCLPLLKTIQIGLYDYNVWIRFLMVGFVSFIWTSFVVWLIGLTAIERLFMKEKVIYLYKRLIIHGSR